MAIVSVNESLVTTESFSCLTNASLLTLIDTPGDQAALGDVDSSSAFPLDSAVANQRNSNETDALGRCIVGCVVGSGDNQCDASYWVYVIGAPLLLAVGTIGNALILIVMATKTMRRTAFGTYIAALATADTLILWMNLPRHFMRWMWLVDIFELSPWSCRTLRFLQFGLLHTSAWLLVTVTAERFFLVYFPSRFQLYRKRRRALWVVIAVAAIHFASNLHIFWTLDVTAAPVVSSYAPTAACPHRCLPASNHSAWFYWAKVHVWLDLIKLGVLPFVLMMLMNCAIVAGLSSRSASPQINRGGDCGADIKTTAGTGCTRSGVANAGFNGSPLHSSHESPTAFDIRPRVFGAMAFGCGSARRFKGRKLSTSESKTVMLLCVSFFYLITSTPAYAAALLDMADRPLTLFSAVATVCLYANNAVNFILYSLSGATFRRVLRNTFKRICCPDGSSLSSSGGACENPDSKGRRVVTVDETLL